MERNCFLFFIAVHHIRRSDSLLNVIFLLCEIRIMLPLCDRRWIFSVLPVALLILKKKREREGSFCEHQFCFLFGLIEAENLEKHNKLRAGTCTKLTLTPRCARSVGLIYERKGNVHAIHSWSPGTPAEAPHCAPPQCLLPHYSTGAIEPYIETPSWDHWHGQTD